MPSGFYNTTDKEKQDKIDKENEYIKARRIRDLQKLLDLPEFRRFCWDLWTKVEIFREPFSQNAMIMSRECGAKSIGLDLLADVNDADVNAFAKIQREFISEQKAKEAHEKKEEEKQNA